MYGAEKNQSFEVGTHVKGQRQYSLVSLLVRSPSLSLWKKCLAGRKTNQRAIINNMTMGGSVKCGYGKAKIGKFARKWQPERLINFPISPAT